MKLAQRTQGEVLVLTPQEDRLDAAAATSFKSQLADFMNQGRMRLVLDLGMVEFVDSSGLGALLSSYRSAVQSGGRLVLCGLRPQVRALFTLTKMNKVLQDYDDSDSACAALGV